LSDEPQAFLFALGFSVPPGDDDPLERIFLEPHPGHAARIRHFIFQDEAGRWDFRGARDRLAVTIPDSSAGLIAWIWTDN
jgi:hypothetical protein